MFSTRTEGGRLLAATPTLQALRGSKTGLVVGIPRGGVVTAAEVAKSLHLPLDIIVARKITSPGNPEFALGAVGQSGPSTWNEEVAGMFSEKDKREMEATARREATRRTALYRPGKRSIDLSGRVVVLVDDGLATGLTMEAAVEQARELGAERVMVATPVSPADTVKKLQSIADDVVVLEIPDLFYAVGQFYQEFPQTADEEVLRLLGKFGRGNERQKRE